MSVKSFFRRLWKHSVIKTLGTQEGLREKARTMTIDNEVERLMEVFHQVGFVNYHFCYIFHDWSMHSTFWEDNPEMEYFWNTLRNANIQTQIYDTDMLGSLNYRAVFVDSDIWEMQEILSDTDLYRYFNEKIIIRKLTRNTE